jgi:hypothetical protein
VPSFPEDLRRSVWQSFTELFSVISLPVLPSALSSTPDFLVLEETGQVSESMFEALIQSLALELALVDLALVELPGESVEGGLAVPVPSLFLAPPSVFGPSFPVLVSRSVTVLPVPIPLHDNFSHDFQGLAVSVGLSPCTARQD